MLTTVILNYDSVFFILGLIVIILLSTLLIVLPKLLTSLSNNNITNLDKVSSYECGFQSFSDVNVEKVYVHFFLISLLFLIFDLEILYLIPMVNTAYLTFSDFIVCFVFFTILTVGLIVEYFLGLIKFIVNY